MTTNKAIYEKYINQLGKRLDVRCILRKWSVLCYAWNSNFFERVSKFYSNLIDIDHPNKIQDPENPNLQRYLRFEMTLLSVWSLVGSGYTKHKYPLYFNNQFPFVHQNFGEH